MSKYYHAGTQVDDSNVVWSEHTRKSAATAEKEAQKMAKKLGGRPVVEYWDRSHGTQPGDCDAVSGSYYVAED